VHPRLRPQLDRRAASVGRTPSTGDRRIARVRLGAAGRLPGPARRPGLPARHLRQRQLGAGDRNNGTESPTQEADNGKARFFVYDSLLSEFAAMGFEYGYSVARPDALVLWERSSATS